MSNTSENEGTNLKYNCNIFSRPIPSCLFNSYGKNKRAQKGSFYTKIPVKRRWRESQFYYKSAAIKILWLCCIKRQLNGTEQCLDINPNTYGTSVYDISGMLNQQESQN